jgi:hypothetical protein
MMICSGKIRLLTLSVISVCLLVSLTSAICQAKVIWVFPDKFKRFDTSRDVLQTPVLARSAGPGSAQFFANLKFKGVGPGQDAKVTKLIYWHLGGGTSPGTKVELVKSYIFQGTNFLMASIQENDNSGQKVKVVTEDILDPFPVLTRNYRNYLIITSNTSQSSVLGVQVIYRVVDRSDQ